MNAQETTVLKAPKRNLWKDIKRHYSVYALLVIPVVYYAIFKYGPVINGQIAFKSFMPAQIGKKRTMRIFPRHLSMRPLPLRTNAFMSIRGLTGSQQSRLLQICSSEIRL